MSDKPRDYRERRAWQDAARARGEIPECGREACKAPAEPAHLNHHTPLIYCSTCATTINRFAPADAPLCYPEPTDV